MAGWDLHAALAAVSTMMAGLGVDLGPELSHDAGALAQIVAINIVLSGDNAVVIALACRGLPPGRRRLGMVLGSGVAIVLRLVFTVIVVELLATPFLKMAAALLLAFVAVKLVRDEDAPGPGVAASSRLWGAIRTIAVADAIMSLDNVLAIAAVAKGSALLLVFGLAVSIPLIVAGAALIAALLDRLPILVWAGAALLGWVAGGLFVGDPWLETRFDATSLDRWAIPASMIGIVIVVATALALRTGRARSGGRPGDEPRPA